MTAAEGAARPLVVDLDGTLLRSDLLLESASRFVTLHPGSATHLIGWLLGGRARLKRELAERVDLDVARLPYRATVVDWLRDEHAQGRSLVLASASDALYVERVADQLGIFDEVMGSDGTENLKSATKRDRLVERYGEGGFDYVGDHDADVAVWSAAATAHVVGGPRLVEKAGRVSTVGKVFEPAQGHPARSWLKSLRPHQWAKNALVAVPLFTAQLVNEPTAVARTLLAILTFSLVASAVYVLNDVADVEHDRHHPTKRNRPYAAGQLSLLVGWVTTPALALVSFLVSLWVLPPAYSGVLAAYLVVNLGYTFWAKSRPVIDVVTLGGLYTLRIVAGAAAIVAPLSMWLLTFSMLFFLSLALIKRVSELTRLRESGESVKGRGYWASDLEMLSSYGVASSIGAIVIFALYVNDPATTRLYQSPALLWGAVPVLLGWLMRGWLIAHRGQMNEDPVLFAIKDRASVFAGILVVACFAAARWVS